jgi:hypothetical protein
MDFPHTKHSNLHIVAFSQRSPGDSMLRTGSPLPLLDSIACALSRQPSFSRTKLVPDTPILPL